MLFGWRLTYRRGWAAGVEYARMRRAAEAPVGICRLCRERLDASVPVQPRDVTRMTEGEINATVREWERGRF